MWLFGYGSLIWRPGFAYEDRREGFIEGWARRFFQSSTDHRGVPGAPGRVVTLVPRVGAYTWGVAYKIAAADEEAILDQLDYREKGGYERHDVRVYTRTEEEFDALIYIGTPGNPNWGGPADAQEIARIVHTAVGPSGTNIEYVTELAGALRAMDVEDYHVFAVDAALRNLMED